jgi:hypothetical protein
MVRSERETRCAALEKAADNILRRAARRRVARKPPAPAVPPTGKWAPFKAGLKVFAKRTNFSAPEDF